MTALLVNSARDINAGGGNISIATEPADLDSGDLLLGFLLSYTSGGGAGTPSLISGFTNINTWSGAGAVIRGCYRVADGTEAPPYNSTVTGAFTEGTLLRLIGAHPSTPIENSNTSTGTGTTITLPSVSATNGPCVAIAFISLGAALGATPSGWLPFDTTTASAAGIYYRFVDAGQSSGSGTMTVSSADWSATVFLIRGDDTYPHIGGFVSEVGTSLSTNNAQPTFAAPQHPGAAGDLCLYFVGHDNPGATAITASTGWTVFDLTVQGSNAIKGAWCVRRLDGAHASGNNTLSVSGATQDYAIAGVIIPAFSHQVSDALTEILRGTPVAAASGNADPPSVTLSPSGLYLVLTAMVLDQQAGADVISAIPTDYGIIITDLQSAASTTSCIIALAARYVNGSSEDPGAFTNTSRPSIAFTLAIPVSERIPFDRIFVRPSQAVHQSHNW